VNGHPQMKSIPIAIHWTGPQFVVYTPPHATVQALRVQANPTVALTIEACTFPLQVMLVRGTAQVAVVDGVPSGSSR
jgi:hypothetical protein